MSRYGASTFSSLLKDCVLWAPLARSAVMMTAKTITSSTTQVTTVTDPWGLARPVGSFPGFGYGLTVPACPDMVFTGDFTIEFYVNCGNQSQLYPSVLFNRSTVDWASGCVGITIDRTEHPNQITFAHYDYPGTYVLISNSTSINNNTWHHVAISRSGSTIRLFIDGQLDDTATDFTQTVSFNIETWEIGRHRRGEAATFGPGYLSEMRFSNIARYTSNFTPSTTRFKPDINTKLLLHMYGSGATFVDDPFIDIDEFPIIPSGVTVTNNGTFTKTSLGNNKSVLNFDGSTNHVSLSDNASFTLGTNAFSLAMWVNLSSVNAIHTLFHLFAATNSGVELYTNASAKLCLKVSDTSTAGNMVDATGSATLVASTWYHITVTRSGSTFTIYINATSDSTGSSASSIIDPTAIAIGCRPTGTPDQYHYGNIKDAMLMNGKALSLPEIKLLMNRTHPETGAGLMPANGDYYKLS